ncbi:hypothetical protein HMPREF0027_0789 [Actinobacillus ureae ATCC 25976]|uniref:Uncharacterized protein n=1 Tax=Actinobacillus ureae ATCC 25976 TaxID=887324 RepID=E8KG22_9PAST|nr:hypothetical protein [Actinobacillus ureae]EFX92146.1 hypothetical protein HMPREF0027_0789 [Actinobacillus ureae ATCC 25976]
MPQTKKIGANYTLSQTIAQTFALGKCSKNKRLNLQKILQIRPLAT